MPVDESEGNGKTGGSYGLPRKHGGRRQLELFLWTCFKLLTIRLSFLCRFRVAEGSLLMLLLIYDVPHESNLCEGRPL